MIAKQARALSLAVTATVGLSASAYAQQAITFTSGSWPIGRSGRLSERGTGLHIFQLFAPSPNVKRHWWLSLEILLASAIGIAINSLVVERILTAAH